MAEDERKEILRGMFRDQVSLLPQEETEKRWRRAAEALRRLPEYRQAARIFMSPAAILHQARMNCLADGKELLMPAAGLKDGFFVLSPASVPFPKRPFAVTLKGLPLHGRRLSGRELAGFGIDLSVADALAVDKNGAMIGKGDGLFDLAWSILMTIGAFSPAGMATVCVFPEIGSCPEESFSRAAWDVSACAVVTAEGVRRCEVGPPPAGIIWSELTERQIRRISPLYQLWRDGRGAG